MKSRFRVPSSVLVCITFVFFVTWYVLPENHAMGDPSYMPQTAGPDLGPNATLTRVTTIKRANARHRGLNFHRPKKGRHRKAKKVEGELESSLVENMNIKEEVKFGKDKAPPSGHKKGKVGEKYISGVGISPVLPPSKNQTLPIGKVGKKRKPRQALAGNSSVIVFKGASIVNRTSTKPAHYVDTSVIQVYNSSENKARDISKSLPGNMSRQGLVVTSNKDMNKADVQHLLRTHKLPAPILLGKDRLPSVTPNTRQNISELALKYRAMQVHKTLLKHKSMKLKGVVK